MSSNNEKAEKQYGLIDPKAKKKMSIADVFGNDSDSGEERKGKDWIQKKLEKDSERGVKKQTIIDMNRALEQDPTVYQYDEVYETMKGKEEEEVKKQKIEKKPKYMDALMKTADKRKKENERRTARLVQKEREAEGDEFKDKEEFITSAYRQKLEEMKQAEEEEKKMEYIESVMDVTKQKDLGSFYRHMYKDGDPVAETNQIKEENKNEPPKQDVNETEPKKTIETNKAESKPTASSSSDSSDSDSSSSSSSSDSDSDNAGKEGEKKEDTKPEEPKIVAIEEKKEEPPTKIAKFEHSSSRKDRNYRQREPSVPESDTKVKESKSSSSHKSDDKSRRESDRDRERRMERERERNRGRRDDRRVVRDNRDNRDRNDSRRPISRSRDHKNHDRRRSPPRSSDKDRNGKLEQSKKESERSNKKEKEQKNEDKKEVKREETKSVEKREEKDGKKEDGKSVEKKEEIKTVENKEDVKETPKINIWEKRTVGAAFDAALERYFQRKAARGS